MKNTLIIGGSGGIGKTIIQMLLDHHYRVINIDRKPVGIVSEHYSEYIQNIRSENYSQICEIIFNKIEKIDIFISAIGYYGTKTLDSFSYTEYQKTIETNTTIPTLFSTYLLNFNHINTYGKMIFISSAAAYVGSRDIPYSISKSAIIGLVKGLAKSLENKNIYIYGVAPGIVETEMSNQMSVQRKEDVLKKTINKRMCSPEEIAKLILFLVSEEKGYMNGSILHMNNGLYFN